VITVNVAASAPTGDYRFTCQPHSAMGMHGKLTVQ
jgi:plastocyanin